VLALLSAWFEIEAAATRGRYRNLGTWSGGYLQAAPHDLCSAAPDEREKL
jgi:hypothetical protein